MTELEKYIKASFGVNQEELTSIGSFFKPLNLSKGDYFLKAGRYSDRLGFLQSGIIREFVLIDHAEVTKWISTKGHFVLDLSSFIFQIPARWNMQALTDCELFVIEKDDYTKIGRTVPSWPAMEKLFLSKCFIVLEDRILQHLSLSAEQRLNRFFKNSPELFNQVPLQYLASMLGMTPETLSRLRKKMCE